ncbi:MAG TPA: hypothetical protein VIJ79_13340 [Acidobacteriaceae bacterium]
MGTVVHISESELRDAKSLLELARQGEAVIIDGDGESFRLFRRPGRTAAEIFSNPKLLEAIEGLDDDWAKDMEEILALRKTEVERDPWEQ